MIQARETPWGGWQGHLYLDRPQLLKLFSMGAECSFDLKIKGNGHLALSTKDRLVDDSDFPDLAEPVLLLGDLILSRVKLTDLYLVPLLHALKAGGWKTYRSPIYKLRADTLSIARDKYGIGKERRRKGVRYDRSVPNGGLLKMEPLHEPIQRSKGPVIHLWWDDDRLRCYRPITNNLDVQSLEAFLVEHDRSGLDELTCDLIVTTDPNEATCELCRLFAFPGGQKGAILKKRDDPDKWAEKEPELDISETGASPDYSGECHDDRLEPDVHIRYDVATEIYRDGEEAGRHEPTVGRRSDIGTAERAAQDDDDRGNYGSSWQDKPILFADNEGRQMPANLPVPLKLTAIRVSNGEIERIVCPLALKLAWQEHGLSLEAFHYFLLLTEFSPQQILNLAKSIDRSFFLKMQAAQKYCWRHKGDIEAIFQVTRYRPPRETPKREKCPNCGGHRTIHPNGDIAECQCRAAARPRPLRPPINKK